MHIGILQNQYKTLDEDIRQAIVYFEGQQLKEQLQLIHQKIFNAKERKLMKYDLSECA